MRSKLRYIALLDAIILMLSTPLCLVPGTDEIYAEVLEENSGDLETLSETDAEEVEDDTEETDTEETVASETGPETPSELSQLYAQSACLLDGDSGRVLYEKNGYDKKPNASTTKILTCILTLENGNLEDVVTVSDHAAKQPDVQLNAQSGEQFKLKNLLLSLMLESHNDSAVAIAEHIGGSVEGFAAMMNQKAMDIGCTQSHFVTPNGLDASDNQGQHSTTATDLAKIMRYCIKESPKSQEFLEITRTSAATFSNEAGSRSFSVVNHNAFLSMMEGALSGKTGFTSKAGYCYVGALERDGKTFIVALLACGWPNHKTYKWSDTRKLMEYGLNNYNYTDVLDTQKSLEPVYVEDGIGQSGDLSDDAFVPLAIDFENDQTYELLLKEGEEVQIDYIVPDRLKAPVYEGDIVGKVQYKLGGEVLREYPVYLAGSVEKIDYPWCLKNLFGRFLCGM